ncbi:MAG: winged helix-turn-helix domain-containing protein [Candidatus Kariarchaeaceae archaeon]|jgi:DNA-binding HxlR family transcriptional regulator
MPPEEVTFEETETILDMMNDPIKFNIMFELLRNPNSSPLELKKKLGIKGSRIYYYLNPLREMGIVKESETEEVTSHLSRSKFKVSSKFNKALSLMRHDQRVGHRKVFHTFQLNFAISLLQKELRLLENLEEEEFNDHIDQLDLPHRQFFFVNKDTLGDVKKQHAKIQQILNDDQEIQGGLIKTMERSEYVSLFGIYLLT